MTLKLQGYTFTIKHVRGEENIADYQSKHPVDPITTSNDVETYVNMITKFAIPKAFKIEQIALETQNEKLLKILKMLITKRNWHILNELQKHEELNDVDVGTLKQFRNFKEELTVNNEYDIILKGNRIVLPTHFHKDAVKIGHLGHQGIDKTKNLMRTKVFFFGMVA